MILTRYAAIIPTKMDMTAEITDAALKNATEPFYKKV